MQDRIKKSARKRLKRGRFVHATKTLEKSHPYMKDSQAVPLPTHSTHPVWNQKLLPEIRTTVTGIISKNSHAHEVRRTLTIEHMTRHTPEKSGHLFTQTDRQKKPLEMEAEVSSSD
jgi:hypothetical protein